MAVNVLAVKIYQQLIKVIVEKINEKLQETRQFGRFKGMVLVNLEGLGRVPVSGTC